MPTSTTQNSLIIGAGTLCSRVLGLVREMCIAWLLGGSALADAFVLAMRIPALLRRLSSEGALSLSLTALLSHEQAQGTREQSAALTLALGAILLCFMGVLVLLCEIFAPFLVQLLGPGLADPRNAIFLLRVTMPYVLFLCLATVYTALLHSRQRFFLPALAPALSNCMLIFFAGLAWYTAGNAALLLSVGMLCGGAAMCLMQMAAAGPVWKAWHPALKLCTDKKLFRVLARIPLGLSAAAAPQLLMLVAGIQASYLHSGAMASLYYAERVMEFPLGLLGSAIAMASLPTLSVLHQQDRQADFVEEMRHSLRISLGVSLPAAAGLCAVAQPLVQCLFMRGAFGLEEVQATTLALQGLSWGIPAYALARVLLAACAARDRYTVPCIASGLAICTLFVLLLCMQGWGLLGVGLTVSGALWLYALVLWMGMRCHIRKALMPDLRTTGIFIFFSGLVYEGVFFLLKKTVDFPTALALSLAIFTGVCIYAAGIFFLCPELLKKKCRMNL